MAAGQEVRLSLSFKRHESGRRSRQNLSPASASRQDLPNIPPGGFRSEAAIAALAGVRVIDLAEVAPGPSPDIYAFSRQTVQRNLYRIPLP
jgi:hypothetical protein